MNHPEFVQRSLAGHVSRARERDSCARPSLTLRQAEMPPGPGGAWPLLAPMRNLMLRMKSIVLNQKPNPANVTYTQVPVNSKQILEGMITGIGGVFVPGLKDAENGTEALTTFQQCFDPRKLHETFVVKDFFKAQDELPAISDADLDAFQQSIESMDKANGGHVGADSCSSASRR
jgi:hypothetical protein